MMSVMHPEVSPKIFSGNNHSNAKYYQQDPTKLKHFNVSSILMGEVNMGLNLYHWNQWDFKNALLELDYVL